MIPGNINTDLISGADDTGYGISRSLRFNSSDSAYLSRVPSTAGNRKTWTWAGWVKKSDVVSGSLRTIFGIYSSGGSPYHNLNFAGNSFIIYDTDGVTTFETTQLFRDPSAWFHVVVARDTTQATASNRVKLYINGTQVTTFNSTSYPALNSDGFINTTIQHNIGSSLPYDGRYLSGYLADIHFIDGQALTPSSFTEVSATTGQLIPKAYTGSFGTNGFWLKFSDNSAATATTLGKDYSGNSNNWTPNNLSVTAGAGNDSLVDTPVSSGTDTGVGGVVTGNYCTWNPLGSTGATLTNGNLDAQIAAGYTTNCAVGAIGVTSGKWYWEIVSSSASVSEVVGICDLAAANKTYTTTGGWVYWSFNGNKFHNNSGVSYGATWTTGDVIGVALNMDVGEVTFYKNGSSQGVAYNTGLSGKTIAPMVGDPSGASTRNYTANFGQRPFAYTAPSGFKALCDTNLPAPVVAKPSTVFDTLLYTGNGASRSITGLGFNPDLVWIKERNAAADHALYDAVRGAQIRLESNTTDAEVATDGGVTAFNSDGFSLGTLAQVNTNADTYVAWAWDAGSTTVTNTQGSITSQVRANASAGFSVVTYTGSGANATIGHGLGVAPAFILIKARSAAYGWPVYHQAVGNTSFAYLDLTVAFSANNGAWNNTSPSSTVFTVGTGPLLNQASATFVAYCFAPVAGYSSFGSYTGNGSADGPFVYTGFRPRWILVKRTDAAIQWTILDTARSPKNVADERLFPNLSQAETVNGDGNTDLLSNGFKPRNIDSAFNASGGTYIYAAFAESPFQYARAR